MDERTHAEYIERLGLSMSAVNIIVFLFSFSQFSSFTDKFLCVDTYD